MKAQMKPRKCDDFSNEIGGLHSKLWYNFVGFQSDFIGFDIASWDFNGEKSNRFTIGFGG